VSSRLDDSFCEGLARDLLERDGLRSSRGCV